MTTLLNLPWWKAKKEEVHKELFAKWSEMDKNQSAVTQDFARYLFMYGGARALNYYAMADLTVQATIQLGGTQLSLNIVKAFCDTQMSKIGKNKAKPMFITEKGMWDAQTSAKRLTMFVDGQFRQSKVYQKADKVFQAATIWGTGVAKIYDVKDEMRFDSLIPQEQYRVDLEEAKYGEPKTHYENHYIDRELLAAEYPKLAEKIRSADSGRGMFGSNSFRQDGNVQVLESIRLPVGKEKGRHVICISNATLEDEEWTDKNHHYEFYHYDISPIGFFGTGIPEAIFSIQIEINKILRRLQKSMHLMSVPRVFLPSGSTMVKNHFSNEIGEIIELSGAAPIVAVAQSIAPDVAQQLVFLLTQAAEVLGISRMSYASVKAPGIDSGKGLNTLSDIETDRHAATSLRWEEFFMGVSRKYINGASRIDARLKKEYAEAKDKTGLKNGYEIPVDQGKFMTKIKWSDIKLKDDQYIMKSYPTNLLSKTPAAKLKDVQDMFASGLIDGITAQSLLDFPDIEAVTSLQTAQFQAVMKVIEMLCDGKYESPDPLMDLQMGQVWVQNAYINYKDAGLPESKLSLFRQWIDEAEYFLNPPVDENESETEVATEQLPTAEEMPTDVPTELTPTQAQLSPVQI